MNILVKQDANNISRATLKLYNDKQQVLLKTKAYIGKNGLTSNKQEGDKKTPIGAFKLGVVFGMHSKINIDESLRYIPINKNLYWIDDTNSKFYNRLVDIEKDEKDWKSGEHLIDYKKQYDYAIEILANPENEKGKGSAIFLHCSNKSPTLGCIAIKKRKLIKILKHINKNTKIVIEQ